MTEGTRAEVVEGCRFSPHAPVRIILETKGRVPSIRRLSTPKVLPVERPFGPQLPATKVEWEQWGRALHDRAQNGNIDLDVMAQEWSAGAEVELLSVFGKHAVDDRIAYTGIGLRREEVIAAPARSFRNTPDSQGILGHRLNWVVRQLHFIATHAGALINHGQVMVNRYGREGAARRQAGRASVAARLRLSAAPLRTTAGRPPHPPRGPQHGHSDPHELPWQYEVAIRIGHRAAAFLREKRPLSDRVEDVEVQRDLNAGLRLLAALSRASRGRPPMLDRWCRGEAEHNIDAVVDMRERLERQLHDLAARRATRSLRETRRWAQHASAAVAHKVTKVPETATTYSASASKSHLGAMGRRRLLIKALMSGLALGTSMSATLLRKS